MFLAFFIVWVIFNGKLTVEIAAFGVVIAGAISWFSTRFLGYSIKKDIRLFKKIFQIIGYFFVLLAEILKANFVVIHIMLGRKAYHPVIVHFQTDLKTDTAKVVLANSITLTPGTYTLELIGNDYYVHCLDKSMAEGMRDSIFVKLLKKMEAQ